MTAGRFSSWRARRAAARRDRVRAYVVDAAQGAAQALAASPAVQTTRQAAAAVLVAAGVVLGLAVALGASVLLAQR